MKTRVILYADEGKILTNGETYGRCVYLADTASPDDYYEITQEEYNEIIDAEKNRELELEKALFSDDC